MNRIEHTREKNKMLVDVIDFRPDLPLEKTLGKNVAVIDVLRCTS